MNKRYVVIDNRMIGCPPKGSVLEWSSHFGTWLTIHPDGLKSIYLGNPERKPNIFRRLGEFEPVKQLKKRCELN